MIKPKDIFSLAVIPLCVTLILLIMGNHQFSVWMFFVFRYQSLIAGILAVAAAVLTVWQMRKSEVAQDVRHQQTLNASTFYPSKDIKYVAEQLSVELKKSVRSIHHFQNNMNRKPDSWQATNTIYYFEAARGIDGFNINYSKLIKSKFRPLIDSDIIAKADIILYFGMKFSKVIPTEAEVKHVNMFSQHDRPVWLTDNYVTGMGEMLNLIKSFLDLVVAWETRNLDEIKSLNYVFDPN